VKYSINYRVIYGDTDCGGVVYHANYLRMFEIARTEYIREKGLPYSEVEEKYGVLLPVVETFIRFKAPAKYDDFLTIQTWLSEVKPYKLRFDYKVLKEGKILVEGYTVHVPIDEKGKLRKFPEEVLKFLEKLKEGEADED